MKKTMWIATAMGLALVFGTAMESKAICLIGCDDSTTVTQKAAGRDIRENSDNNTDAAAAKGVGNTAVKDVQNSVVVGGDVSNKQSNFVGAIGFNKGDLSQSNSANMTGQQNIHDNDMRTIDSNNRPGR